MRGRRGRGSLAKAFGRPESPRMQGKQEVGGLVMCVISTLRQSHRTRGTGRQTETCRQADIHVPKGRDAGQAAGKKDRQEESGTTGPAVTSLHSRLLSLSELLF